MELSSLLEGKEGASKSEFGWWKRASVSRSSGRSCSDLRREMETQEQTMEQEDHPSGNNRRKRRLNRKDQKARRKRSKTQSDGSCSLTNQVEKGAPASVADQPATPTEEEVQASYVPTPIPTLNEMKKKHQKSLGKWFPRAVVLKSSVHYTNADIRTLKKHSLPTALPRASILLFYQYVDPMWPESTVDLLIAYLIRISEQRPNLGGRIRVAREGLNVTLSAADCGGTSTTAALTLRHFCRDLQRFDPQHFAQTDFKFIHHVQADRHFKDLKIFPVQELVFYGFGGNDDDDSSAPLSKTGVHLQPTDFHNMLRQDASTTVVIDVRNHYEAALGRFDGQERGEKSSGGAEYIDPKMRKSTDFSRWLAKPTTQDKLEGKNVMLYCTGGVRCERASAYLNHTMGDKVKGVYQLQGGIERYLQDFKDGGHWRGKNFVFDKREACGAGDKDGDGGVVNRKLHSTGVGHCCLCKKPWDRFVGKKKCSTCGVPVLMCNSCMSNKKQAEMLVRCPLCVEENVTMRAESVEWTNNGVDISSRSSTGIPETDKTSQYGPQKAAPSVLKWGGGHASRKRDRRRFQHTPCRFGADCVRKDCFFAHPESSKKASKGNAKSVVTTP